MRKVVEIISIISFVLILLSAGGYDSNPINSVIVIAVSILLFFVAMALDWRYETGVYYEEM